MTDRMFVFPKFIWRSHNLQCKCIWKWGLWEVIRVTWGHDSGTQIWRIDILKKEGETLSSYSLPGCTPRKKTCEKAAICHPKKSAHQIPTPLAPWFWTSSLQSCNKINFYCRSHPVCSYGRWEPTLIHLLYCKMLLFYYRYIRSWMVSLHTNW